LHVRPGTKELFIQTQTNMTGTVNASEVCCSESGKIFFVNTEFNSICELKADVSFSQIWKPPLFDKNQVERGDFYHLNGLGMQCGVPRFVTSVTYQGPIDSWRKNQEGQGVIWDMWGLMPNSVYRGNLSIPHSPRVYRGGLWFLESGRGTLNRIDLKTHEMITVATLGGLLKGLCMYKGVAFVAASAIRRDGNFSDCCKDLANVDGAVIWMIDLEKMTIDGALKFPGNLKGVSDLQICEATRPYIVKSSTKEADQILIV